MNLPSSLTKSFEARQLNFLTKRGNQDSHDDETGEGVPMDEMHRQRSSASMQGASSRERQPPERAPSTKWQRWRSHASIVLKRHAAFVGPGIVASVGYTDPGNW